jgi:hypothetical protein
MGRMAQASLAGLDLLTPLFDGECAIPVTPVGTTAAIGA